MQRTVSQLQYIMISVIRGYHQTEGKCEEKERPWIWW